MSAICVNRVTTNITCHIPFQTGYTWKRKYCSTTYILKRNENKATTCRTESSPQPTKQDDEKIQQIKSNSCSLVNVFAASFPVNITICIPRLKRYSKYSWYIHQKLYQKRGITRFGIHILPPATFLVNSKVEL